MASATGMPRQAPEDEEPLLGRPGDVQQTGNDKLVANLYLGTAVLAQAGIWILAAVVWAAIFDNSLSLFSAHPLLNVAGLLLMTQAILVLQPTHTPTQKRNGTLAHAAFHSLGVPALIAGLIIIEYNKIGHDGDHFVSAHSILGLITYIFLILQSLVGFTQYWTMSIYGGEEKAKAVWKYHRMGGYVTLIIGLATICAAAFTDFNNTTLKIKLWTLVVPSVLVVLGVLPRVKLQKLGLKSSE